MALPREIKQKLRSAAGIREPAERSVKVAATIAEALRTIDQDPILVGGAAVEFYTQGGYSTSDIDMIAEGGPALRKIMEQLGFKRQGKDFLNEELKIYVEFPGRHLKPTEVTRTIQLEDQTLSIISPEDLVVDRLCAFKYWKSAIDGINALLLLENEEMDEGHLSQRVREERVMDALQVVLKVRENVIRKKLNPEESNALILKEMKTLN